MTTKRCIALLAGCALLFAPAAAKAVAGDGLQLGPVLAYPVLKVAGTYDDNIGLASEDRASGWVTTIAPSLRLALPVRRFYLNVEGGAEFLSYSEGEQDESTDWFVGAAVGADFPGGLSFKIADKQTQRYLVATQEYGPGEDYATNALTATVAYAVRNALRLELNGRRTAVTYSLSEDRERVETMLGLDVFWRLRPAISAVVGASQVLYEYDSNTAQDNRETAVSLGLTWDVTARSTGVARAGYQWKRYDGEDASLGTEDAEYYTLAVGLRHSFTSRTTLDFDLTRSSQESDFPENPYYLRTTVGANLSQRLTRKFYGRLGVRYGSDDYPNATTYDNPNDAGLGAESGERTDETLSGNVALGFDATRWLTFEVGYAAEKRDSNFDTFDYDVNRVTLSATAAF